VFVTVLFNCRNGMEETCTVNKLTDKLTMTNNNWSQKINTDATFVPDIMNVKNSIKHFLGSYSTQ
jgi:hypothetical protein